MCGRYLCALGGLGGLVGLMVVWVGCVNGHECSLGGVGS